MKLSELRKLGIKEDTLDEEGISLERAVVSEEFRSDVRETVDVSYRDRAIERLFKMRQPFSSEANILYELGVKLVRIICPYCHRLMKANGGGGAGGSCSTEFKCPCGAQCNLAIPHEGIRLTPPRKG